MEKPTTTIATKTMRNVVDPNAFYCTDAGQPAATVTVTATDGSGNFDTCTSKDNCAVVVAKTVTSASFTCASLGRLIMTAAFTDAFNNVATTDPHYLPRVH
jgi:uncharacterized protein GlcG (DUF336 family)